MDMVLNVSVKPDQFYFVIKPQFSEILHLSFHVH